MELKRPYLIKVTWVDIVGTAGWEEQGGVNIEPVEQWGVLVYRDKQQIKIADSKMAGKWYGITAIPTGCIKEIRKITEWK